MFEFINAIVVLCNLPSVFVDGEEMLRADGVRGMFSFNDDNGDGNNDGMSRGGSCGLKKTGELFLGEQLPTLV